MFDESSRLERKNEATRTAFFSGVRAFFISSTFAAFLHFGLASTIPRYKMLHPQPKTFLLSSFIVAATVISAERAQLEKIDHFRDAIEELRVMELKRSIGEEGK